MHHPYFGGRGHIQRHSIGELTLPAVQGLGSRTVCLARNCHLVTSIVCVCVWCGATTISKITTDTATRNREHLSFMSAFIEKQHWKTSMASLAAERWVFSIFCPPDGGFVIPKQGRMGWEKMNGWKAGAWMD